MKIEYCFLSLETGKSPVRVLSELLCKSEVGILQRVEGIRQRKHTFPRETFCDEVCA